MSKSFMARYGDQLVAGGFPILPIVPGEKFPGTCLSGCRRMITLKNDFNYFFNSYVSIHQVLLLCRDYRMLASIPLLWLN